MDLDKYRQAKSGASYALIDAAGYLQITGADQASFVQRQTTNDMNLLKAGCVLKTVLTSPTARILDVWTVFQESDGQTLGVLPLPGRADWTLRYVQSRIFFQDKVAVNKVNDPRIHLEISGPETAHKLRKVGLFEGDIPGPGEIKLVQITGSPALLLRDPIINAQFRLILPPASLDHVVLSLNEQGFIRLSPDEGELLRIEAGIPAEKRELTEEYTPLETGLQAAVAGDKGCYTGQEVLARQINYDKITRRLVGLRLASLVQAGSLVLADSRPVGEVTSAAVSPAFGAIALAVLKRPFFEASTPVSIQAEQDEVSAQVSALPFQ